MKLFELEDRDQDDQIPFDVIEDLTIFMRNDPMFYRKTFFPAMSDVSDKMDKDDGIDPVGILRPMVDKGVDSYCKKFAAHKRPQDLFTDDDRVQVVKKIQSEELPHIKKGMYKAVK